MDSALSNAKRATSEDIKSSGDGRPADYLVWVFQIILTDVKNTLEHHPGAYQAASMYSTTTFGFVREAKQTLAKYPSGERLSMMLDLGSAKIKGLIVAIMDAVKCTPFAPSQPPPANHGPPSQACPPPKYSYQSSYAYPSAPPKHIIEMTGHTAGEGTCVELMGKHRMTGSCMLVVGKPVMEGHDWLEGVEELQRECI